MSYRNKKNPTFICSACWFHSSRLVCPWFRSIAKVVSQVHAFQSVTCPYSPDRELQDYLRRRIAWLAASDRQLMVTDAGLLQSSERQRRKIQEKLKRVKASFQWAPSVVILMPPEVKHSISRFRTPLCLFTTCKCLILQSCVDLMKIFQLTQV